MQKLCKALGLLLLLLLAQQGAVEHELGHFSAPRIAGINAGPSAATEAPCALCPAFAQAVAPAFGHSFPITSRSGFALTLIAQRRDPAADIRAPRPRSRGPPASS